MSKETLSQRHEREFAELVPGGEQTIASGAKYEKHDVKTEDDGSVWRFLFELKSTQQKGYRLTNEDWQQLVEDTYSRSSNMRPAWAIRFYGPSGYQVKDTPVKSDLVVMELNDYIELLEEMQSLRLRVDEKRVEVQETN